MAARRDAEITLSLLFSYLSVCTFPALRYLPLMHRWSLFIFRARWALLLLWMALVAGAVGLLPDLQFHFNLGRMLRGDDARVSEIKQFYKTFPPSDGHMMVSASSPDVLTINNLRAAERWAAKLRALPEVKDVISPRLLLNLKLDGFTLDEWASLGGTGEEPLEFGDGPGMEGFRGNLVSKDGKSVALYLIRERKTSGRQLHAAVKAVAPDLWQGSVVRVVGT